MPNDVARRGRGNTLSAQAVLGNLVKQALDVAKKAARHQKSLIGVNYYADKMATLRADATNAFSRLGSTNVGHIAALAELISKVFGGSTPSRERAQAARDV